MSRTYLYHTVATLSHEMHGMTCTCIAAMQDGCLSRARAGVVKMLLSRLFSTVTKAMQAFLPFPLPFIAHRALHQGRKGCCTDHRKVEVAVLLMWY